LKYGFYRFQEDMRGTDPNEFTKRRLNRPFLALNLLPSDP
jgi:hypothetical protein